MIDNMLQHIARRDADLLVDSLTLTNKSLSTHNILLLSPLADIIIEEDYRYEPLLENRCILMSQSVKFSMLRLPFGNHVTFRFEERFIAEEGRLDLNKASFSFICSAISSSPVIEDKRWIEVVKDVYNVESSIFLTLGSLHDDKLLFYGDVRTVKYNFPSLKFGEDVSVLISVKSKEENLIQWKIISDNTNEVLFIDESSFNPYEAKKTLRLAVRQLIVRTLYTHYLLKP